MPSTFLFIVGTLLLSLNFIRVAGLAVSDWFYLGALGFACWETLTIQKRNLVCWWKNPFIPMAFLICLGAIISTSNASFLSVALIEIAQQLFVITIFVSLIWIMIRRGKIKIIIIAFISSGVFSACIAILDYLTGSRIGPFLSGTPEINSWGRYAGTLGHPNKLGFFLVMTVLLTIGYWLGVVQAKKLTGLINLSWGGLVLVQIFGIYITNSLTAYIGLIIGILPFIYVLMSKKVHIKKIQWEPPTLLIITCSIILIFTMPYIKTSSVFVYIQQAIERVITTTSVSRIVVYKLAWYRILENPFIGVGYDQIATSGIGLGQSTLGTSIHNALLQIMYTGGLVAFTGWIAIYIYLGWSAIKVFIRKAPLSPLVISLAAAVLAVLVMDQFQDAIYQREKWLLFGILVCYSWESARIIQTNNEK